MTPGFAEPGEAGGRSEHLEEEGVDAAAVKESGAVPPELRTYLSPGERQ